VLETWEGTLRGEQTLADFAAEQSVALTRFAYLLCGDRQRAEDLVQDAVLALHRRFGGTLSLAAPVAYARKAIVNAHISQSRKRSASERVTDSVPDAPAPAADRFEQDAMWHALQGLPERQRAVLVLRYYLDLSDPQVATTLGCREGTVRSLAARGFAALRRLPEFSKDGP
jgi:RNA polymerase sigma-70 factor (sigma-E family)